MKIVQVFHGYPMRYNAGSEVYTLTLAHALANRHDVYVFTRQLNSFLPEYHLQEEQDPDDPRVKLRIINLARARDPYRHAEVDQQFGALLAQIKPALVHVGHLLLRTSFCCAYIGSIHYRVMYFRDNEQADG
jgi:hypothetical protein